MHNLKTIAYQRWPVKRGLNGVTWDPAAGDIVVVRGPVPHNDGRTTVWRWTSDEGSPYFRKGPGDLQSPRVSEWSALLANPAIPVDRIIDAHHFPDTLTTVLIFHAGDIVTVTESPDSSVPSTIEIIGSIEAGIAAATWSPDEEVLVLLSLDNQITFMGRDFISLAEKTMGPEDLSLSKHVSVGWGKKETQFEGRGAKALRDPTIPLRVDQGEPSPYEDDTTTISWRGDGAVVAVNSVVKGSRRAIRVYTRDGVLDGVSEPVDGLEGALSWRPEGNLIAGVQRLPGKKGVKIVFFERNGLRHGEFMLREEMPKKVSLHWNCDSTVLAIIVDGVLQLWTMGNYHWYLKHVGQQQEFPAVNRISWHPEKPLKLAVISDDTVFQAEYAFTVTRGPIGGPKDLAMVAVVDGTDVLLTPFTSANVPPPLDYETLTAKGPIVGVAISENHRILAIASEGAVELWALKTRKGRYIKALPITHEIPGFELAGGWISGISRCGEKQFIVTGRTGDINRYSLITVDPTTNSATAETHEPFDQEEPLLTLSSSGYVRAGISNEIWKYTPEDPLPTPLPVTLADGLPTWDVITVNDSLLTVGLSRNGVLYAGKRVLAKNCTSYLVTPDHVVFTTKTHLVKFIHLAETAEALDVPADDPEADERVRNIERGGKLINAIPSQFSLILQMPRGNLETINPRVMVVAGIRSLIDAKDYRAAFAVCRTHRVDMNLLFDHRPKQFLNNVKLVLDQVKEPSYIDLFLSSLKLEDTSQTMYRNTKTAPDETFETGTSLAPAEKVNAICDAVLSVLTATPSPTPTTIQNTITAHVCKQPPATDDGLRLVAQLQETNEALAEKAVEHICFLADPNKLFEHALGLYDLKLALLVAQQTQKDPREYVPFTQELHAQAPLRRKFTIDDHLGRRDKALVHLYGLDVFDEFTKYTVKYSFYQQALFLYRYDAPRHAAITLLFAEYLESHSKHQEAGLAYESLSRHVEATRCYRAAGATCWQECLFNAQLQTPALSASELSDLATTLAEALYDTKEYKACASVNMDYLHNLDEAVRAFCKGYHFSSAIRTVTLHNRPDLLTAAVDPGIVEALSNTTEFLAQCKSQIAAQVPRILELRQRAEEDPLAFYEGERGGDIPDDISVAASSRISAGGASLFTRYTGTVGSVGTSVSRATSKNRRREEKKRARGRKGTVYEEEYLVSSVRRLVERVDQSRAETERLVTALVRRNMAERARAVERLFGEMEEACRKAVTTVFREVKKEEAEEVVRGTEGIEEEIYIPKGAEAVMIDSLRKKGEKQEPPIVKKMERLALLGCEQNM